MFETNELKQEGRINLFSIRKTPIKRPNREGLRLLNNITFIQFKSYPKKCSNEGDKFKYLTKLLTNEEVSAQVFVELSDVLKLNPKTLKTKVSKLIGKKVLNQIREDEIKW